MAPLSLVSLLSFAVYLYVGLYALNLDPRSRINRFFLLLCVDLAWWAFFYAFVFSAPDKEAAWFWFKLSAPAWCLIGGIGLHLVLVLTEQNRFLKRWWSYLLLYLPGITVLLRTWTGVVTATDFTRTEIGWVEVISPDSLWLWLHTINYSAAALTGLFLLYRWGKGSLSRLQQKQARIFIGSVGLFFGLGTLSNLVLPLLKITVLPSLAPLFGLFWVYGAWKAIVQYRFMVMTPAVAAEEIISRMSDMLILTNQEGLISQINPQVEKILGYQEEELLQQPISRICRDEGVWEEAGRPLTESDSAALKREAAFQTKDGELIPVRITWSFILSKSGETLGLMVLARDQRVPRRLRNEIQVRRRAEDALIQIHTDLEERIKVRTDELYQANKALQVEIAEREEMEKLFRTLFVQSPIGTYIAQEGKIKMANPEFERITGFREKELLTVSPLNLVQPDDRSEVRTNAVKMLRGERHQPYEFRVVGKDGRIMWILETVTSIQYQGFKATLGSLMDISQRKESEETIRRLAFQDSLTGLPNRVLFHDRLSQALAQAGRNKQGLTLMMIDLDNFKEVNDQYGHQQGDRLLKEMGQRLLNFLRKSDTVARMGGDEFMILLPDTGQVPDAQRIAEKLLEVFQQPMVLEGGTVQVSASIGLALYPKDGVDGATLIKNADRAMYRAKAEGRNRIAVSE
ncbi:MAG: diguanylate cyclase [Thermodesulfobacteriota bacterium]